MKRVPAKHLVAAACALLMAACGGDEGSSTDSVTGAGTGGTSYVRAGNSAGRGGSGGAGGTSGASGAAGRAGRPSTAPPTLEKAVAMLVPLIVPPSTAGAGGDSGAAGSSAGAGGASAGAGGVAAGAGGMMTAGSGGSGGMSAGAGGRSGGASGRNGGSSGRNGGGRGTTPGRNGAAGMSGAGAGGANGASGMAAGGMGGSASGAGGATSGAGGASAGAGGSAGAASVTPATKVTGMATFTNLGSSVELSIGITSCVSGKSYPIHIHTGTSCADAMSQGGHWDPPRGEGIPNVECGMMAYGTVLVDREASDAKPWTVGPPADSNVIGHVVVLHDPDDNTKRIACGEIKSQP